MGIFIILSSSCSTIIISRSHWYNYQLQPWAGGTGQWAV